MSAFVRVCGCFCERVCMCVCGERERESTNLSLTAKEKERKMLIAISVDCELSEQIKLHRYRKIRKLQSLFQPFLSSPFWGYRKTGFHLFVRILLNLPRQTISQKFREKFSQTLRLTFKGGKKHSHDSAYKVFSTEKSNPKTFSFETRCCFMISQQRAMTLKPSEEAEISVKFSLQRFRFFT